MSSINWSVRCATGTLCVFILATLSAFKQAEAQSLPACDLSKTNHSCELVIDRQLPVAPPSVQMYSGQTLTVRVTRPLSYERYFLDYSTGAATLAPDATSSIVQGLFPSLPTVAFGRLLNFEINAAPPVGEVIDPCSVGVVAGSETPARRTLQTAVPLFRACLFDFASKARQVYKSLEPYIAPDSITSQQATQSDLDSSKRQALQSAIDPLLTREFAASANITTLAGNDAYKAKAADPGNPNAKPPSPPKPAILVDPSDAEAINELTSMQKVADAIAADLLGYRQRLAELESYRVGRAVLLTTKSDDPAIYQNMVSRSVTYSLDALNLVSNSQDAVPDPTKKRALASIVIVFADSAKWEPSALISAFRWEASAGVFISTLPNRSFSVAPTYTGTTVTNNTVHEQNLSPTAVPFAAANYRLTDDLGWSRWKSNAYWSFAIGVNPNTKTADFAVGPSLSWRALMISAFAHFGHEARLTQGFSKNENLGPTFTGTLPTDTHWVTSFALGFSVRVPALIGR